MSVHVIVAVVAYFVFAAAVGAMALPTEEQARGFYGWFYRFCQRLAANADRLAEARLPGLGIVRAEAETSATIQRITVIKQTD